VGLPAIILLWKYVPDTRIFLIAAFLFFIAIDIFTVTYFIPRNELMFQKMSISDKEGLSRVWKAWSFMNWFRSLIALAGVVAICISLHKTYVS
jgi:flagellar biosynthesis protein FlhB